MTKNRVAEHIACLPRSGIRNFFELVNTMDDVISLSIGEPDKPTPQPIRQVVINALNDGITSYTANLGMIELREEICTYTKKNSGVAYSAKDECIVTVGVSEGLDLIMRAILNPGDEVLIHEPSYVSYSPTIAMSHAKPVKVATTKENNFVVQAEDIVAAITPKTKIILLNYPNNPTGATLSYSDKEEISKIAVEYDLIVITDEIYEDITYGDRSDSIAAFPGMKERTIILNGFSKNFAMTGFRIAYALGPNELISAMMKIHQYSMLCAPRLGQIAAIEALKNCHQDMVDMRDEYQRRRDYMVKSFNKMGLDCFMPKGAFYAFPNISSTGLSSLEFATKLLKRKKVAVIPGTAFGEQGEGHVRCCYATSMEEIKIAMQKISEFLSELI